ncbi:MAG: adenylate/guanylate cyclase domain-containing protein [Arenicellales bacterium]
MRSLLVCAVVGAAGTVIGVGYSKLVGGTPAIGALIGLSIGLAISAFELLVVSRSGLGTWLRRLSLPLFIGITTFVWAAIIIASLYLIPPLYDPSVPAYPYAQSNVVQDFIFSFVVSLTVNAAIRVRALLGSRVLLNFLLGRYHHPLREERVFLFLDLAGSSALAERLGDVRVQSFIGRFFFDIARPIAELGGETHRYIGDEVVVTWPLRRAVKDARCVRCVLAIQALVAARAQWYQGEFGTVPRFRVGMHGGPVVVSEIGDTKREIVYFGDTINTAARLEQMCKELHRDFLISGDLLRQVRLPHGVVAEALGELALPGKARKLDIYALSSASTERAADTGQTRSAHGRS